MSTVKEILSRLVAFPVLGGESNLTILEYIRSYLDSLGVPYHLVKHETEPKASLHCRIGPPVDGGIILSGHMDVVPVEGQDWDSDPFELTQRNGKLFARGTCDMKGFLACCLASVPKMLNANLTKPIYLAFSYDEEVGCIAGPALAKAINDTYKEKPAFCIVGEPSLLHPVNGEKGIFVMKTTVNGSAGHSSRIKEEVSAVHEAARLVLWLENKMDQLIESGQLDDRFSPNHTSFHIGLFNGGIAHNIVADHCEFLCDIRVIPKDNLDNILKEYSTFCREREGILRKRFPAFKIDISAHHDAVPPLDTPEGLPVIDFIRKLSGKTRLQTVAYASEAGQFSNAGFQTVVCGPGSVEQAHRANEFISIEQLEKGMDLMERLIAEMSDS